jgi:hypothetical protein
MLSPFMDHFHPVPTAARVGAPSSRPEARRRGSPFLAVNVVPHAEQVGHVQPVTALMLTPLIGNTGDRQGQVGPVGLHSPSIVCPQVDPITRGNKFARPWCSGTPRNAYEQRAPPNAARRHSPTCERVDTL